MKKRNSSVWRDKVRDIYIAQQGNWNATKIYEELSKQLTSAQIPTHINSIQKYIAKNREEWMKVVAQGLEKPWTWAELREYNLSSEACLLIDRIKELIAQCNEDLKREKNPEGVPNPPLTIRQALWVARLGWLMKKEWEKGQDYDWKLRCLYLWACAYATHEILHKLNPNEIFETSLLDQAIKENFIPIVTPDSTLLFDLSRSQLHIDTPESEIPKTVNFTIKRYLINNEQIDKEGSNDGKG